MFPFLNVMHEGGFFSRNPPSETNADLEGARDAGARTFTAGGLEWNSTLAKMRRLRRVCEFAAMLTAVFVTALVCAFRVTTRAAAYAVLFYAGVFFEFLRRGSLAVAARQTKRDAPHGFDAVCEELRSAYAFAWLSAVWLCWIAGNEILLSTKALAGGEPFGETVGTAAGLVHVAFALLVSWPGLAETTSLGIASELAFPALLASALLIPTSKTALQHGGVLLAVTRTAGAFLCLFALQTRSDMVLVAEPEHGPSQATPVALSWTSSHARQLRAAKLVVQSAWLLLVPAPFMFAVVLVVLFNDKQQRNAFFAGRPSPAHSTEDARPGRQAPLARQKPGHHQHVSEGNARKRNATHEKRGAGNGAQSKEEARRILEAARHAGGEKGGKEKSARSQDLLRALHLAEAYSREDDSSQSSEDEF